MVYTSGIEPNRKARHVYTVSQIEHMTGVTRAMLIDYEKKGVLVPKRSGSNVANNRRLYDDADIERLKKIVALLSYGFTLKEIKELLDDPNTDFVGALQAQTKKLRRKEGRLHDLILFAKFVGITNTELFEGLMSGPEDLDALADFSRSREQYESSLSKLEKASEEEVEAMFGALRGIIHDFSLLSHTEGFAGMERQVEKFRLWWDEYVAPLSEIGYLGFWAIFEDDSLLPAMVERIGGETSSASLQMACFFVSMKHLMMQTCHVISAIATSCEADVLLAMELAKRLEQAIVWEMHGSEANAQITREAAREITEEVLGYMDAILADEELRAYLDPSNHIRLMREDIAATQRVMALLGEDSSEGDAIAAGKKQGESKGRAASRASAQAQQAP